MRCTICGREAMNPEANYCDYCGSSFRECGQENRQWENGAGEKFRDGVSEERYSAFGTGEYRESTVGNNDRPAVGENKKITIWTYLGVLLLPLIPWIGTIAWFVILCYWSFSIKIDEARKCFARAYLIYMGIAVAVLAGLVGMYTALT